jgi:hypothetical protein
MCSYLIKNNKGGSCVLLVRLFYYNYYISVQNDTIFLMIVVSSLCLGDCMLQTYLMHAFIVCINVVLHMDVPLLLLLLITAVRLRIMHYESCHLIFLIHIIF